MVKDGINIPYGFLVTPEEAKYLRKGKTNEEIEEVLNNNGIHASSMYSDSYCSVLQREEYYKELIKELSALQTKACMDILDEFVVWLLKNPRFNLESIVSLKDQFKANLLSSEKEK
jgi:hypothetical protein